MSASDAVTAPDDRPGEPVLRIVRGDPTDDELAALVAVVLSQPPANRGATHEPASRSGWAARWRSLRTAGWPGPEAWRLSGRS